MRSDFNSFDQSDIDVWMEQDITQFVILMIKKERMGCVNRLIAEPTQVQAQKIKTIDRVIGLMKEPNKK